jgi:hypothetical protein
MGDKEALIPPKGLQWFKKRHRQRVKADLCRMLGALREQRGNSGFGCTEALRNK